MADGDTLLAYLVPKLTGRVEDTATEALAYILRKSPASVGDLADLAGIPGEHIVRVETQVVAVDGSRPDLVCFDSSREKRVIVEAKFWAGLMDEQPNAYLEQLPVSGRSALLFIVPEVRSGTLWSAINKMVTDGGIQLEREPAPTGILAAKVTGTDRFLVLTSWTKVLDGMLAVAEDADIRAEIVQLRGLAQRQDEDAFLPLHAEELAPAFARRMRGYVRLVNEAVDARGVGGGWMTVAGLRATPQSYGYGRYFRFAGAKGDWWFGINHEMWASVADTPLWLTDWGQARPDLMEVAEQAGYRVRDRWISIRLRTGVEYDQVLEDVVRQLQEIGKAARSGVLAT